MKTWTCLVLLLHLVTQLEAYGSSRLCPTPACTCSLDSRGLNEVTCVKGNMHESLPAAHLDNRTEVLTISAPEGQFNQLTMGPIFRHLKLLEELTISRSRVPAIGEHTFWGLKNLKLLDLTQNKIQQILDEHFRGLVVLKRLHLDDNLIESMPSSTFRYMEELEVLTLARNRIGVLVPRVFLKLSKLKTLDLSHNPLGELDSEVFKDIRELREFKCRSCGLSNINPLLYRVAQKLQVLDLSYNEFKFLSTDEFGELRHLRELYMDGNKLSVVLDKTFGASTPRLNVLSLSKNRIAKVTNNAFKNATALNKLNIGYNQLDSIEAQALEHVNESLHTLTLSGNSIADTELKHAIQAVPKLQELNLADMGLSSLPLGIFVYHDQLTRLNLSGNHFNQFSSQILSPVNRLTNLDLSANRFRGLDPRLVNRLETAEVPPGSEAEVMPVKARGVGGVSVNLQGNPWKCDRCSIGSLLEWIARYTKAHPDAEVACDSDTSLPCLRCTSPKELAGRRLISLDLATLDWCEAGNIAGYGGDDDDAHAENDSIFSRYGLVAAAIAAAIAVLLLLIAIAAAAVTYSRHHAHYYTREEERIQASSTEREAIFENPGVMLDEHGDLRFAPPGTIKAYPDADLATKVGKKKKSVTIATIDEITRDPELQNNLSSNLTNGSS